MKRIEVYYNRQQHISRLITGFHLLEQSGKISVDLHENTNNLRGTPHPMIVEAIVDGKRIAFDMSDAFALNNDSGKRYLDQVDAYFKRSYSCTIDSGLSEDDLTKIRPFGFDYYATYKNNPVDGTAVSMKQKIRSAIFGITGREKYLFVDSFEKPADYKAQDLKIIFMARLWDPADISLSGELSPELRAYREYMIEERIKINADRIELIRRLRKEYGNSFMGGIQANSFSEKMCPDLLVPKAMTRKKNYMEAMQHADICIGSTGLHKSIGWKTGEYVAASRAIVAERFEYEVTGNFEEGINYIPFDTVEQCLGSVEALYKDPDRVYAMKRANEQYYREYLRPEQQIINALGQVVDCSTI